MHPFPIFERYLERDVLHPATGEMSSCWAGWRWLHDGDRRACCRPVMRRRRLSPNAHAQQLPSRLHEQPRPAPAASPADSKPRCPERRRGGGAGGQPRHHLLRRPGRQQLPHLRGGCVGLAWRAYIVERAGHGREGAAAAAATRPCACTHACCSPVALLTCPPPCPAPPHRPARVPRRPPHLRHPADDAGQAGGLPPLPPGARPREQRQVRPPLLAPPRCRRCQHGPARRCTTRRRVLAPTGRTQPPRVATPLFPRQAQRRVLERR